MRYCWYGSSCLYASAQDDSRGNTTRQINHVCYYLKSLGACTAWGYKHHHSYLSSICLGSTTNHVSRQTQHLRRLYIYRRARPLLALVRMGGSMELMPVVNYHQDMPHSLINNRNLVRDGCAQRRCSWSCCRLRGLCYGWRGHHGMWLIATWTTVLNGQSSHARRLRRVADFPATAGAQLLRRHEVISGGELIWISLRGYCC